MKRTLIVFAIFAMCLVGFYSCKDTMKCWHVKITATTPEDGTMVEEGYMWVSENGLDTQIEQLKADMKAQLIKDGKSGELTFDKVEKEAVSKYGTKESCENQNVDK